MQFFNTYFPVWSIVLIIIFIINIYSTIERVREQKQKRKIIPFEKLMQLFRASIKFKMGFFKDETNFVFDIPTHNPSQIYSSIIRRGKSMEKIIFNETKTEEEIELMAMMDTYMGVDKAKVINKIKNEIDKKKNKKGKYIEYHFPKGEYSQKYFEDLKARGFWKMENPNFNEILTEQEIVEKMELYNCFFIEYLLYKEYKENDIIYSCFIIYSNK